MQILDFFFFVSFMHSKRKKKKKKKLRLATGIMEIWIETFLNNPFYRLEIGLKAKY